MFSEFILYSRSAGF